MKEQQNLLQETEVQTQVGEQEQELKLKNQVTQFAKERNYVLNKGLATYLLYGDLPQSEWEQPLPQWAEQLPEGPALQKL